jgi:hypothetical protein
VRLLPLSLILELLMLEPVLVLEFALEPVPVVLLLAPPLAPPVPPAALVLAPPLMLDPLVLEPLVFAPLVFEPLLIEPLLIELDVSVVVAGATAPPAVDVSVVLALLFLLHAATAIKAAARIAMRFMKSSGVIIRERCATFSASMHSCTRALRRQ